MGWTYNDTANRPAPTPNYPIAPNSNFSDFYKPTANSFNPINYAKPNSFGGGMAGDLNDPLGNQTQLMQMIAVIVQQILGSFMQGGMLGNLAGNQQAANQPGGGIQGNGGYAKPFGSANASGFGGYGGYNAFPNSFNGYGYEGGMSNFRPFANDSGTNYPDTKGWWGRGPKDCEFGESFRNCKNLRDPDCEVPNQPPKRNPPPKDHNPPEHKTPPKHNEPPEHKTPPKHNEPPKHNKPPECDTPPKHNPPPEKPGKPVHGSVTGDPHFLGADGEKYDIKGEPGKTYNLIADKNMSVNARFDKYGDKGATVMDALGFNFGKDKLALDVKDGKTSLTYNGKTIDTTKNWNQDGYSWDASKKQFNVKKTVDKENWDLTTNVKGKGKDSYLDLYINKNSKVDKNDTKTTGLWGDSISGKKEDVNKNGGAGVITGSDGKPLDKKHGPESAEYKKALASKEVKDLGSKKP